MPRFFFHLRDHRFTPDEIGEEFPDVGAAGREALRVAADMLRDMDELSGRADLAVVCTDAAGEVVSAVCVSQPPIEDAGALLAGWREQAGRPCREGPPAFM